ncbi:protein FAR1-RELATED SEQUENCE 2-like [Olea europaea var. sylvestris]|uniref:protein FAR1-RELATED SEQUENCE 2-like n=1 Tax=Olea europaea var. sylvestris TaxID=158386 RepID=UPI000C1D201D|nr:protein FAR1-RELATED SEQUENCE 2-like [Olea europaea var. sylvestris]
MMSKPLIYLCFGNEQVPLVLDCELDIDLEAEQWLSWLIFIFIHIDNFSKSVVHQAEGMVESGELLVESDDENVENNMIILDDENIGVDDLIVPAVGMKFKDETEVFDFYKRYGYAVGFPVRKRNSKKDDDGVLRYVTLTCSREGRRSSTTSGSLKPQPTIQTDCKARISASFDVLGTWRINTVHLEHNHKTSPSKSRLYRCNRELSAQVKRRLEVNDTAGIPLHKSFNSAVVEAGDAVAIQSYFSEMQVRCSGFYFSIDLDDESRLKNVFWADYRCRQAYREFGDVVTFDTTYLTNKYDMPFAPFVGVNHHCQSTLLGCGLISNEDTNTFVWLFRTWLKCMHGQPPHGIITDQDRAMQNAIEVVFPHTKHRWCLWHILKKLPEKFGYHCQSTLLGCGLISNEDTNTFVWLFRTWLKCMHGQPPHGIITDQDRAMQNAIEVVFPHTKHRWCLWHILKKLPEKFGYHVDKGLIFSTIHELVYDSQFIEQFEQGWRVMIDTFELHDNDWLSGLYENRGRWVPCYFKTTFWAGMSTTQRSESMNAFFDGYVHAKTSLKQFVEQYERALRNKVEKEFQADFKSFSQMVPCATTYEMEKQFQSVYTISKFREVQAEFTGKVYCDLISASQGHFGMTYEVREDVVCGNRRTKKTFRVVLQKDTCDITCSCHLFEFRGIICRHTIAVLIRNDVTILPSRYILRRWRRDVSRAHTRVPVNYAGLVSTPGQLRYDNMCQAFSSVADLAADDEVRSRAVMNWIEVIKKELMMSPPSTGSNILSHNTFQLPSQGTGSQNTVGGSIGDPKQSKKKGAPKKLRRKSPLETCSKKTKVSSTACIRQNNPAHDAPKVQGGEESFAFAPHIPSPSATQLGKTHAMLNSDDFMTSQFLVAFLDSTYADKDFIQ